HTQTQTHKHKHKRSHTHTQMVTHKHRHTNTHTLTHTHTQTHTHPSHPIRLTHSAVSPMASESSRMSERLLQASRIFLRGPRGMWMLARSLSEHSCKASRSIRCL